MFFQKCCQNRIDPVDIALDDGEYFCRLCRLCIGKSFCLDYKDYSGYIFQKPQPYKLKNHASHILNRLECKEANKPSIDEIRELGLSSYSKRYLCNNLSGKMRKHLTHIWCVMNNIEPLSIKYCDRQRIIDILVNYPKTGKYRSKCDEIIREAIYKDPILLYIEPYLNLPYEKKKIKIDIDIESLFDREIDLTSLVK